MGGGKSKPPPAPDYSPYLQGSQVTAQSSLDAARIQADVANRQMDLQNTWAQRSADQAQQAQDLATQQYDFGKQQYADIKPYLQDYMNSQLDLSKASEANLTQQTQNAQWAQDQAEQMQQRYQTTFAPVEDKFAQQAQDYASPARMEANAAAARGDVATAFQQTQDAATRQLQSYGVDPSQGAFRGTTQAMNISKAAALAAAGTMSRQQTQQQGMQYELAATQIGQKLPAQAVGYAGLGSQQVNAALQSGQLGGGGVTAGTSLMGTSMSALGNPASYMQLANPYTSLAGSYGTQATGLYGNQVSALGTAGQAYNYGGNMLNNMFSNQMEGYKAQAAAASAPWQALGNIAGMGIGFGMGTPGPTRFGALFGG